MTPSEIIDVLAEENPEALLWDGLEDALVGVVRSAGVGARALYSRDRCIEIVMGWGATYEEALEHLEFNTFSAYMGPETPCWVNTCNAPAREPRPAGG